MANGWAWVSAKERREVAWAGRMELGAREADRVGAGPNETRRPKRREGKKERLDRAKEKRNRPG